MKKRMLALLAMVTVVLTGCGGAKGSETAAYDSAQSIAVENGSWDGGFGDYDMEMSEETADATVSDSGQQYEQKLIRTFNYNFETLEFDASMAYVEQKVAEYGGYIESSETSGNTNRYASLTIRIPEKNYQKFINDAGEIGEIIYKSSSSEDITLSYYDTTARLESLNTQHERLLELLANAGSLDDIVTLESQLADVEYEINRYTTMLLVYDNKVDYVTFNFSIREVHQIQAVEDDSFWTQIKKGLSGNTATVIEGLMDFAIFLITGIPFFLVIGVVVLIVVLIVKKVKKNAAKKTQKRMEQMRSAYPNHQVPPYVPAQPMQQADSQKGTENQQK